MRALTIHCPACAKRLRLPDEISDHALQCPACAIVFTATANVLQSVPKVTWPARNGFNVRAAEAQSTSVSEERVWKEIPSRQTSRSFTLTIRPRRLGKLRRMTALACGFSVFCVTVVGVGTDLIAGSRKDAVQTLGMLCAVPLLVVMGVCIGAVTGAIIETFVRLLRRRPEDSILLALAGEMEENDFEPGQGD